MKNFELDTIVNYVKDYHTDELVEMLMQNRNDRKKLSISVRQSPCATVTGHSPRRQHSGRCIPLTIW